jgi:hypothetical protein
LPSECVFSTSTMRLLTLMNKEAISATMDPSFARSDPRCGVPRKHIPSKHRSRALSALSSTASAETQSAFFATRPPKLWVIMITGLLDLPLLTANSPTRVSAWSRRVPWPAFPTKLATSASYPNVKILAVGKSLARKSKGQYTSPENQVL